jgi:hypothetical protein
MSAACVVCGRAVSGGAGDPRIAVPLDFGEGAVGSYIVCRRCGPLVRAGVAQQDAQMLVDALAERIRRGPQRWPARVVERELVGAFGDHERDTREAP